MLQRSFALLALALFLLASLASAHGGVSDGDDEGKVLLDESIRQVTLKLIIWGGVALAGLVLGAVYLKRTKKLSRSASYVIFFLIVAVIVGVTSYVAGSTIYLNVISVTGGPVHWHADFEIWECGSHVDLVNPKGMSNKVGSAVFHEHGDNRIHVEGVIVDRRDAALGEFLEVVGGELRNGLLRVPTAQGEVTIRDGDDCGGSPGILQAFVWKTVGGTAVQSKLDNYEDYVLSPYGQVPPGDCIILEFGSVARERTGRTCESYEVAIKRGVLNGS